MPLSGIPDWRFKPHPSFKFLEDPHEYHLKGKRLWSPSGVFKDIGYVDMTYYTKEHQYRGQYVHRALHLIDEGDTGIWKQIHHDFLGYVEAGAEFKEVWKFKPRMRELPIYHPDYLYGVTPDAEGLILGGDEAIVEYKTGTMLWWTAIQTAAQDLAVHCWDKDKKKTRRRIGVELKKNGKFRVKEFDDEGDYNVWIANLTTARRHHQEPPKKHGLI
jgi:hypothetical protein